MRVSLFKLELGFLVLESFVPVYNNTKIFKSNLWIPHFYICFGLYLTQNCVTFGKKLRSPREAFQALSCIYISYCFILFTHSDDDLKNLHQCLNELHPSIKYTMEQNRSQLPFLDTLIINK